MRDPQEVERLGLALTTLPTFSRVTSELDQPRFLWMLAQEVATSCRFIPALSFVSFAPPTPT